jgi:hypothetical protein
MVVGDRVTVGVRLQDLSELLVEVLLQNIDTSIDELRYPAGRLGH